MKTRAWRTPVTVWIAVGLLVLFATSKTAFIIQLLLMPTSFGARAFAFGGQALAAVFTLYLAAALARLSRWPVVLALALSSLNQVSAMLIIPRSYSLAGLLLIWLPIGVYAALTLPHWRKMNWALLGRPYRPAEDKAEVFA